MSDEGYELCGGISINAAQCDFKTQFECNPGNCIDKNLVCDGKIHCSNGQNESSTMCERKGVS